MPGRILSAIGALRCSAVVWGLAGAFCAAIVTDALFFHASQGLQRTTYDSMVRARLWSREADPRIVILDIDEASLAKMAREFGRWPWPRDPLATVLAHLERENAAAIVWDVLFVDADVLHPGGDAAFDAAVRRSRRSHFSVLRVGPDADADSQVTPALLPGLWAAASPGARASVIPPFLPAVAASPVGYSNTQADGDGVLRRYRYAESLADGSVIQSVALSVARAIEPAQARLAIERLQSPFFTPDPLMSWRASAFSYPRVPFWQEFDDAENGRASARWKGKVVVVGSTAAALHDYHPSPVAPHHPGVMILATAIDNALHGDVPAEVPHALLAAFAMVLCLALAAWAQFRSIASLEPLLFLLPAALFVFSYASLNGAPVFLELQWPAAVALTFLAILRVWVQLRREHWCAPPAAEGGLAVWPLERRTAWAEPALDRLIDAVERHAPDCRIVAPDAIHRWPGKLRWPELARHAAIVGPAASVEKARELISPRLRRLAGEGHEPVEVPHGSGREGVAQLCLWLWARRERGVRA